MEMIKATLKNLFGKKEHKKHWDKIFKKNTNENLGWYENDSHQTIKFLNKINKLYDKTIFISGAGTSFLVDELIGKCDHLIINDISDEALSILKKRIGDTQQKITWLNCDISRDLEIENNSIDIWIDRAVLHFLTEENQIAAYFQNLDTKTKKNSYSIIAEFSTKGSPDKCAGLKLHRYSIDEIVERSGPNFELLEHEYFDYISPQGYTRTYIYCFLKKIAG